MHQLSAEFETTSRDFGAPAQLAGTRIVALTSAFPRPDRLGSLLHEVMERTPRFGAEEIPEEDWIEDFLTIERVEPGELWFEGGIGPVRAPKPARDLAQVGWGVNIVLAKLRGEWRIVELGFVYP